MPIEVYSRALSEAEVNIKSHWEKALDGIEAKSIAYIWEIFETGDNHLFFIKRSIGTVERVIKELHNKRIISKDIYDNAISDLENLKSHLDNLDKKPGDPEEWLKEAKQHVSSAVAGIQSIKSAIERRTSMAARLRKGARKAAVGALAASAALGVGSLSPTKGYAQNLPRNDSSVVQDTNSISPEIIQRYRNYLRTVKDPHNYLRYLQGNEYLIPDNIFNIFLRRIDWLNLCPMCTIAIFNDYSHRLYNNVEIQHLDMVLNGILDGIRALGYSEEDARLFWTLFGINKGILIRQSMLEKPEFTLTLIHERVHREISKLSQSNQIVLQNAFSALFYQRPSIIPAPLVIEKFAPEALLRY